MVQENYEELTDEEKILNNYFLIKNIVPESYEGYDDDKLVEVKEALTDIKEKISEVKDTVAEKKDNTKRFSIITTAFLIAEIILISILSVDALILTCGISLSAISEFLFLNQYFSNKKLNNQSEKLMEFIDKEQELINQKLLENYNNKINQDNKILPSYLANNRARYEYEEELEEENKNELTM